MHEYIFEIEGSVRVRVNANNEDAAFEHAQAYVDNDFTPMIDLPDITVWARTYGEHAELIDVDGGPPTYDEPGF
jgi:hypothetical protein